LENVYVTDVARLLSEYRVHQQLLTEFGPRVEALLREVLRERDIRVHSVTHRVKAAAQLEKKVSRPGADYDTLSDIHDLLGLRVITFFPDDVDGVAAVIKDEFPVDYANSVDKRAAMDPDRFGYLSLHYIARLSDARAQLVEHRRFAGIPIEIQIRSILQHAWAEIEHDLGYKNQVVIPRSVRRRFSRLAGLLEVADSEFQGIRVDLSEYAAHAATAVVATPDITPLDSATVASFIEQNQLLRELDERVANIHGARFVPDESPGHWATDLICAGFTSIGDVADALASDPEAVERFTTNWIRAIDTWRYGQSLFFLAYIRAAEGADRQRVADYVRCSGIHHSFEDDLAFANAIIDASEGKDVRDTPKGPTHPPGKTQRRG
jgi:putative GTP pyrophosphokinase